MHRRLSGTTGNTFHAAKLQFRTTSKAVFCLRLIDKFLNRAVFVYALAGRPIGHLSERVREHHLAWLNTTTIKGIVGAV